MSRGTYAVPCPLCGAEHRFNVVAGAPRTLYYPGHGPSIDWRVDGCECYESPLVRQDRYTEHMERAAWEEAQSQWSDPMDDNDAAYQAARDEGRL
jgi:hypothetical protein